MIKADEITNPNSCLNKAADDEPIFVLRGRDILAAEVVRFWATIAQDNKVSTGKVLDALTLADRMELWPHRKLPD
jgi:hypothetical protein